MSVDRPYGSPQWQLLTNGFADGGSGGGIPEAPTDGQTYGRVGATASWTPISTTGGGIGEAPADGQLYSRRGSTASWVVSPAGGGGAGVIISDTAPASPAVGTLWWNSTQGNTYLWYQDINTAQWVQQNGTKGEKGDTGLTGATGSQGPQGPAGPTGTTDWAGIVNKPATFPPSAHSHVIADTTGLQAALDGKLPTTHAGTGGTAHANVTTSVAGFMIATDKVKLDGIATGAGVAVPPATVVPLMNGTGAVGTTTKYAREDHVHPSDTTREATANKGVASGYASLDSGGKVPATQLPAYVDDVLEYANLAAFPATGVAGVLYLAIDTGKLYRWTGTVYVEISPTTGVPSPSDLIPVVNGTAIAGVSALWSRGDHVHPTDTSRLAATHAGTGGTAHANVVAAGAAGFMTGADKTKLDGIATGANLYVHPTGDGNLHVPVTGTVSNGMVLKAGATAGSGAWAALAQSDIGGLVTALAGKEPTIAAGTTAQYWRGDKSWVAFPTTMTPSAHNHPQSEVTNLVTDLALKAPLASPAFSGVPTAPTAAVGTDTLQIASTAFVKAAVVAAGGAAPSNALPLMNGTATIGVSLLYTREGHIHPTDTSRQAADATLTALAGLSATVGLVEQTGTDIFTKRAIGVAAAADILTRADGDGRYSLTAHTHAYSSLTGIPATFTPSAHGHPISDITSLQGALDAKAPLASPTFTGTVSSPVFYSTSVGPVWTINKTANNHTGISMTTNGVARWLCSFSNSDTEAGGNAGSNFAIYRYDNAGAYIGMPFHITRATGDVTLQSNLVVNGSYIMGGAGVLVLSTTSAGNVYLRPNGQISGAGQTIIEPNGNMSVNGGVYTAGVVQSNPGYFQSGDPAGHFLCGANGGHVYFRPYGHTSGANEGYYMNNGKLFAHSGFSSKAWVFGGSQCKNGASGDNGGNIFNFLWNSTMVCWVDDYNAGYISLISDYRTKKDVEDLPSTWDVVKALRPIKYTQAEFTPPRSDEVKARYAAAAVKEAADRAAIGKLARDEGRPEPEFETVKPAPGPLFEADDIERWGFLAHELQETLVPSASSGVKDMEDGVQSPQWAPVVAAVTRALQEAMARIEDMQARIAVLEAA